MALPVSPRGVREVWSYPSVLVKEMPLCLSQRRRCGLCSCPSEEEVASVCMFF